MTTRIFKTLEALNRWLREHDVPADQRKAARSEWKRLQAIRKRK